MRAVGGGSSQAFQIGRPAPLQYFALTFNITLRGSP